jgi:23S rRNA-/tRNA-specific pseudouridylate synthase
MRPDVTTIPVIHVTAHEIVVCKAAGLASELPRDPHADSLLMRLRAQGFDDLRLVHRLDSLSCGLMLVARTAEAAAYYGGEIAARRWQKLYVAQVASAPDRARALIGPHKAYLSTEGRRARVVRAGGKPSFLSIIHVAPVANAPEHSHLLVQLHTGRFHQIRVMLATLGAPLTGDALYGGPSDASFYLEHVVLAARPHGEARPRVWTAPPHGARPGWHGSLAGAVEARASSLVTEA